MNYVEATLAEQLRKTGANGARVERERGVRTLSSNAAQVIPREAPGAVLLGDRERLDCRQGA